MDLFPLLPPWFKSSYGGVAGQLRKGGGREESWRAVVSCVSVGIGGGGAMHTIESDRFGFRA